MSKWQLHAPLEERKVVSGATRSKQATPAHHGPALSSLASLSGRKHRL